MRNLEATIGANVRTLRANRGWSQAKLASELQNFGVNLTQPTIAKLEGAERPIRVNELQALAFALGVSVEGLIKGSGEAQGAMQRVDQINAELARTTGQMEVLITQSTHLQHEEMMLRKRIHELEAERMEIIESIARHPSSFQNDYRQNWIKQQTSNQPDG